jgi:hypothetical protein
MLNTSHLLVTPLLIDYKFIEDLSREAAIILNLNLSNLEKYQQFKISIFLNFNHYLMETLLFLPDDKADSLLASLSLLMEAANEDETIKLLNQYFDPFLEIKSEFLNIIKCLKK